MPTLDFKGKQLVYAHHLIVPSRTLEPDAKKSLPLKGSKPSLDDSLIIHGDNLHALKSLMPRYAGRVNCIYIDPPYNTGNEGWIYNDNVNNTMMQEWLKDKTPVDGEDLERHEKWLCMMWPRLHLLRELLAEDGVIFISIDDNEQHHLRMLMDEIFGEKNLVSIFTIKANPRGRQSDRDVATLHDNLLCYAKDDSLLELGGLPLTIEDIQEFDEEDENGEKWRELGLRQRGAESLRGDRPEMYFPIYVNPKSGAVNLERTRTFSEEVIPKKSDGREGRWMWSPDKVSNEIDRVYGRLTKRRNEFDIFIKDYLNRNGEARTKKPKSIWLDKDVNTETGGKLLREILSESTFPYPKPIGLLKKILSVATGSDSIVLDSFAGSGTTAHAVLALNKEDGGNRKFILVECEEYADTITAERVRRVIRNSKHLGFPKPRETELLRETLTWSKLTKAADLVAEVRDIEKRRSADFDKVTKQIKDNALIVAGEKKVKEQAEGLGGSFTYCTLGDEIGPEKMLTGENLPDYETLARHLVYTATGQAPDKIRNTKDKDGFFYETSDRLFCLIYEPNLAFLRSADSALNSDRAERIAKQTKKKQKTAVVFATHKFMGQKELTGMGITFCGLPYGVSS